MDGERDLARAVIEQAFKDADLPQNNYHRTKARCFLMGYPKIWEDSLFLWCDIAGLKASDIMFYSRKKWGGKRWSS